MKKVIILIALMLILTGCVNVKESTYENIIEETVSSKTRIYNTYRKGYKFYLPYGLYVEKSKDYNEVIKSEFGVYYMYIDLVSYLNKNAVDYEENEREENVFFKYIEKDSKTGFVQIKNSSNDKYLVEINYNCAKIEMIVEKDHVKNALADAMIILSSIKYNDSFLEGVNSDSLLNYKEEIVDIFDHGATGGESNILEWKDEYDDYDNSNLPDWDHIKEGT